MGYQIEGLIKWASSVSWRDTFDDVISAHLIAANEFELDEQQLFELLGDRVMDLHHCAFEDLVATTYEDGSNIVNDYIKRRGWKEGASTRAYMQAIRDSLMSLYEISDIVPGVSFMARDLVQGGEPVLVAERTATRSMLAWDRMAARLVTINGKTMMTGAALRFTPRAVERALSDIAAIRDNFKAANLPDAPRRDPELTAFVLKGGAMVLSAAWLRDVLEHLTGKRPLLLSNVDGELFEYASVRYQLKRGVTQAKVRDALAGIEGLHPDGRNFWVWLLPDETGQRTPGDRSFFATLEGGGASVFADISLEGRTLNVLVNSRTRAEEVVSRLVGPLQGLVGDPVIEEEAAELDDEIAAPEPVESPEDVAAMLQERLRQHYLRTLDEPVPMLGGKTPRAAIKSEAGRRAVADWLKHLENAHERDRDISVAYDPSWLWDELDLRAYRK